MSVIRTFLSPGRLLVCVWMLVLVAAGVFLHPIAWLLLVFSCIGLGLSSLINVGTEAGENWSKALYSDEPESRNHWSRKQQ